MIYPKIFILITIIADINLIKLYYHKLYNLVIYLYIMNAIISFLNVTQFITIIVDIKYIYIYN
jgi:hypothetical protein